MYICILQQYTTISAHKLCIYVRFSLVNFTQHNVYNVVYKTFHISASVASVFRTDPCPSRILPTHAVWMLQWHGLLYSRFTVVSRCTSVIQCCMYVYTYDICSALQMHRISSGAVFRSYLHYFQFTAFPSPSPVLKLLKKHI